MAHEAELPSGVVFLLGYAFRLDAQDIESARFNWKVCVISGVGLWIFIGNIQFYAE